MSIPPESPWRGAAASCPTSDSPQDNVSRAQYLVETIYNLNCRYLNLPDIEYRSSDGEIDIRRHVFRWSRTAYTTVFEHGFVARPQEQTPHEIYYNLEHYVNNGGRPLNTERSTTSVFVSTTISSSWHPSVNVGNTVYRYEIYAPRGILVAETLGENYAYPGQDEVAFPSGIAPQYIRSAQAFQLEPDSHGHTRRRRVDNRLYLNTNFNPHPGIILEIARPVFDCLDPETSERRLLTLRPWPQRAHRERRSVDTNDDFYISERVTNFDGYIDSAFRSTQWDEAYIFIRGEYVLMNYANDTNINDPLFIGTGFPSLVGTDFAEYGIDAAFGCHADNEAMIFSGNLCARINAPGTTKDWIIKGPKTIRQMFPFFKGTIFEKGIDAAFESTRYGEAYLFKGSKYALIHYDKRSLVAISDINAGFPCLDKCGFAEDIGAAFASHRQNEAYLFKGNKYILLHFTPGKTNHYIISGPKEIVPTNWPSLQYILPCKNRGLDVYEFHRANPYHPHDEL